MGRRKDDPALQAAKGHPGRRKKQTNRAIEAAAEAAEHEATSDPAAVPSVLAGAPAYYRRAIALWRTLAATLRTSGRMRPGYRGALTRYCIWSQHYEAAAEQLRKDCPTGNHVMDWTPVNGAARKIAHPSLKIMAQAEPILRAFEDEFGLTPRADQQIARNESFNRSQQRDLFEPAGARGADADGGEADADPLDLMTASDSAPPPTLN